jgi:hypothetical protein
LSGLCDATKETVGPGFIGSQMREWVWPRFPSLVGRVGPTGFDVGKMPWALLLGKMPTRTRSIHVLWARGTQQVASRSVAVVLFHPATYSLRREDSGVRPAECIQRQRKKDVHCIIVMQGLSNLTNTLIEHLERKVHGSTLRLHMLLSN